jgi:hypothetical protein
VRHTVVGILHDAVVKGYLVEPAPEPGSAAVPGFGSGKGRVTSLLQRMLQLADSRDEDESTKELIANMFSALWFGTCKPSDDASLLLFSPDATSALSPFPVAAAPAPLLSSSLEVASIPKPALGRRASSTPAAVGARGGRDAAAEAKLAVMLAERSIAQIVELVLSVDSTDWLASMVRRLLYGGDDKGDPRAGERKVRL